MVFDLHIPRSKLFCLIKKGVKVRISQFNLECHTASKTSKTNTNRLFEVKSMFDCKEYLFWMDAYMLKEW